MTGFHVQRETGETSTRLIMAWKAANRSGAGLRPGQRPCEFFIREVGIPFSQCRKKGGAPQIHI